jgi:hypothetical protein
MNPSDDVRLGVSESLTLARVSRLHLLTKAALMEEGAPLQNQQCKSAPFLFE